MRSADYHNLTPPGPSPLAASMALCVAIFSAWLPERLRRFKVPDPPVDLDDAYRLLAMAECTRQELVELVAYPKKMYPNMFYYGSDNGNS